MNFKSEVANVTQSTQTRENYRWNTGTGSCLAHVVLKAIWEQIGTE